MSRTRVEPNDLENRLIRLFNLDSKADLESECRSLVIRQDDLVETIFYAKMPETVLDHRSIFRTVQPTHLALRTEDFHTLDRAKAGQNPEAIGKIAGKIAATIKERKNYSGHLFWRRDCYDWWYFYFTNRDVAGEHWEASHAHLVCHLTHPRQDPEELLRDLAEADKPRFPRGLHVRYLRKS